MAKKPIVQGGVENYLGKQPQVVAPRKWQSSPDAPPTELAYITKEEKDLILKDCLLYTSPSPRDGLLSRMPSSA